MSNILNDETLIMSYENNTLEHINDDNTLKNLYDMYYNLLINILISNRIKTNNKNINKIFCLINENNLLNNVNNNKDIINIKKQISEYMTNNFIIKMDKSFTIINNLKMVEVPNITFTSKLYNSDTKYPEVLYMSVYNITKPDNDIDREYEYLGYDVKGFLQFKLKFVMLSININTNEITYKHLNDNEMSNNKLYMDYYRVSQTELNIYTLRFEGDLSYIDLNCNFSFPIAVPMIFPKVKYHDINDINFLI